MELPWFFFPPPPHLFSALPVDEGLYQNYAFGPLTSQPPTPPPHTHTPEPAVVSLWVSQPD